MNFKPLLLISERYVVRLNILQADHMVMAEIPLNRKLPLSKVLQQGGYYKPKTLTDEANSLSFKAKYLRKLPSVKPDMREVDERMYGTRNGLISASFSRRKRKANPYYCILQQKKTLDRIKGEVTDVDRTVAEARRRRVACVLKRRPQSDFAEMTDSIFLTSLITPSPAPHAVTTSFLEAYEESNSSVTNPPLSVVSNKPNIVRTEGVQRSASVQSSEMRIKEITMHCENVARDVGESKNGLERDMRIIKEKLGLFARHLSVMDIERRRRKYFLLRKTFQIDTKVKSPLEAHAAPPWCRWNPYPQRDRSVLMSP